MPGRRRERPATSTWRRTWCIFWRPAPGSADCRRSRCCWRTPERQTRRGIVCHRARSAGFPCSASSASPHCWRAASSIAGNSWAAPRDLWTTDYGRLLALKIGLFAVMVGIARSIGSVSAHGCRHPRQSRAQRNSLAETGLGLCVMLVVGALGTLSPSGHAHRPTRMHRLQGRLRPYPLQRSHGRRDHRARSYRHSRRAYSRFTRGFLYSRQSLSPSPRSAARGALDAGAWAQRNRRMVPGGSTASILCKAEIWTVRVFGRCRRKNACYVGCANRYPKANTPAK